MNVQLDTNILTRLAQPSHRLHATALAAVRGIRSAGHGIAIVPQNLFEFWVVATRPIAENGLGLSVPEAKVELDKLKRAFVLLLDTPTLLGEWERLTVVHNCRGKPADDARIIAAMNVHLLTHLLTFNVGDFSRYTDIVVLDAAADVTSFPTTAP
jgi:predicted nucleic acid-binding protein